MKTLITELASLMHECFATDQASYALQHTDGSYRRRTGLVTPQLLADSLTNEGSIAVYQKCNDQTVKWVCYDFDILKRHLETDQLADAEKELYRAVAFFCNQLDAYPIPYLLEFSGNRGFHVWITFSEYVDYGIAYSILETILIKTELHLNSELITIDKFPNTRRPSGGIGKAVKLPVSMHKKSSSYSLLFKTMPIQPCARATQLDQDMLKNQIDILSAHQGTTKSELERLLNEFFAASAIDSRDSHRIKGINVSTTTFSLQNLVEHWQAHPPLAKLSKSIIGESHLGHHERKLLVGILSKVKCKSNQKAGHQIIHEIVKKHDHYNYDITENAISSLSSYNFPTQEQIEGVVSLKFDDDLSITSLLDACIPSIESYEEATFDIGLKDLEVSRISELNYLYLNDEVHIRTVINELTTRSGEEVRSIVKQIIEKETPPIFYSHNRKEKKDKIRRLVTPDACTRIATSCIFKQLLYFLDFQRSPNSHGYRPNKGFQDGYIFKPWLFLWIKFVSNISSAIHDESNSGYFIVKTDIGSFYDEIPHDNLKRLLLGGVNPKIDTKLSLLKESYVETYKAYIDVLFTITELMVGKKKGLPQGPAYARYLAELYLDNIDNQFDDKLKNGKLYLYQRYVDDIFFIAPTEESARETLDQLNHSLEIIGLSINPEKTIISEIRHFSDDFDSYRAQSKYAVDRASRDFINATETQKDLAISEFMSLVSSENCQDDLAFVFSHLDGVKAVESIKKEMTLPTIESGIGRGSLYKHLFSFVLRDSDNWEVLEQISSFTELQSEVLSAVFVTEIDENKQGADSLLAFMNRIVSKLHLTPVVEEHIAFLSLTYGIDFSIPLVSPEAFIKCLHAQDNGEALFTKTSLVNHINTALNAIRRLDNFCRVMYALCSSLSLSTEDLNNMARTFYSKISSDHDAGVLENPSSSLIRDAKTAWRFYYLVCLFSLSEVNDSIDLLKSMWKFCAGLFNMYRFPQDTNGQPNWFRKIGRINLHSEKTQLVIASIVDGNVFRGLEDKCNVFKMFHNNLLIYLAFKESGNNTGNIQEALKKLEACGTFYQWLANPNEITLFPSKANRQWFERNVMENAAIVLRKGDHVLFRKPTEEFHPESIPINPHDGYSEVLELYSPNELRSFKQAVESADLKDLIGHILESTTGSQETQRFPNVFVNERVLRLDSWQPFSKELLASRLLIFEDANGETEVFKCSDRNFVSCCLRAARSGNCADMLRKIDEKYLRNLTKSSSIIEFLKNIAEQLGNNTINDFYFDIAAAASLYQILDSLDPLKRIEIFIAIYHKFNSNTEDRHIYGVVKAQKPDDINPMILVDTIINSLKALRDNTVRWLAFFLDGDVEHFKQCVLSVMQKVPGAEGINYIEHFKRGNIKLYHTRSEIAINDRNWSFENVRLLNYDTQELISFDPRYSTLVNSSEHVYWIEINGMVHILAIPHALSKIYHSIKQRYKTLHERGISDTSFPYTVDNTSSIKDLPNFHMATQVVGFHRNINTAASTKLMIDWLQHLPEAFHSPLVNLIAAHETMTDEEMDSFTAFAKCTWNDKDKNPFLLKRPSDFNGTHRLLQRDQELGRILKRLSPLFLPKGVKIITLISDTLLTGGQAVNALRYYCGIHKDNSLKKDSGYFDINIAENEYVIQTLKHIEQLNICCVFYTNKAIEKLKKFFETQVQNTPKIEVTNGRDISENAFFGSSQRIGEADKDAIKKMLCEKQSSSLLVKSFMPYSNQKPPILVQTKSIEDSNLVARYGSMTKKGFLFLAQGLKYDPECHPFVRVRETYEM